MTEQVKIHSEGLTKLDALRLSIAMWEHIEATGVRKPEAMEALGMRSSDFLFQCPCCEYVSQRARSDYGDLQCEDHYGDLQCEDHCPAWLEFSANFVPGGDYPCVRNPNSPYCDYHVVHPVTAEKDMYKKIASNMLKLLVEAFERNLDDSE
jgi:hypothetical protein